jgi:hypothetical protein
VVRQPQRIYNKEILRSYWNDVWRNNVFFMIYESDSCHGTKGVLQELDPAWEARGIQRNITLICMNYLSPIDSKTKE